MSDVQELLSDYIAEHKAGGKADPLEYLNRVEGTDRAELAELIDGYLARSPGRDWNPEAFRGSPAERAAESLSLSLAGPSGWWPMLLPRLRAQARLKRAEVVERLSDALGVRDPQKREKVAAYYHRMEHGDLPSAGVSRKVLEALSGIYGATAERLRALGKPIGAGAPPATGEVPAMTRTAMPDERYLEEKEPGEAERRAEPVAPAARDEIDEMFTGGS